MATAGHEAGKSRKTVVILLLAVVILVIIGAFWFYYIGIFNSTAIFRWFGIGNNNDAFNADDTLLLEKERLVKRERAVESAREELDRRERSLSALEERITAQELELIAFESQINEREKTLISDQLTFENKRAVILENVRNLSAIPPNDAVAILMEYDDQLLIDTLQVAQEVADEEGLFSLVPIWLSLLPPDRASAVQRKTVLKYGN